MAVSKQYVADLVAEMNLDKLISNVETSLLNYRFAVDVANGMCAECCYDYCECY